MPKPNRNDCKNNGSQANLLPTNQGTKWSAAV